jgi:hypothetical protein
MKPPIMKLPMLISYGLATTATAMAMVYAGFAKGFIGAKGIVATFDTIATRGTSKGRR